MYVCSDIQHIKILLSFYLYMQEIKLEDNSYLSHPIMYFFNF